MTDNRISLHQVKQLPALLEPWAMYFVKADGSDYVSQYITWKTGVGVDITPIGKNTHEHWLDEGNEGTVAEFLASLIGPESTTTTGTATNFNIPDTTESVGQITMNGQLFIHAYGSYGLFIGKYAGNTTMTGTSNSGFGYSTLSSLTTGGNNTAIGRICLQNLTTGSRNFGMGYNTLRNLVDGNDDVMIGSSSGYSMVDGNGNTGVGSTCFLYATGDYSSGFGYRAFYKQTTPNSNTGIGAYVGYDVTTGGDNLFLGKSAGRGITTGPGNTIVGGITGLAPDLTEHVIIGTGTGTERVRIDAGGHTTFHGAIKPKSYTVATTPSASAAGVGAQIFVSDDVDGSIPAFSDGVNWLRMSDRAIVSIS